LNLKRVGTAADEGSSGGDRFRRGGRTTQKTSSYYKKDAKVVKRKWEEHRS
jgi:hypothetical protein